MEQISIPHSREAEEAVVAAVVVNPEVYYDVSQHIGAEDFYVHSLRYIWQAVDRLVTKKIPIDFLTVNEELKGMGKLEEIGGPAFVTGVMGQVPHTYNAEAYAEKVADYALRRRLISAANTVAELAYSGEGTAEDAADKSVQALSSVSSKRTGATVSIRDVLRKRYDEIDHQIETGEKPPTIPMYLEDMAWLFGGGYRNGAFTVLAARPGQGKSTLLALDALAAARAGKKVYFSSLEMSNEEIVDRILTSRE